MNEPFDTDAYRNDPPLGDATHRGARAVPHPEPRNRQLLIIAGLATLALLLALAVWQSSGTRGAKHDFASANDKVLAKQKEVEEARRTYDQKIAELRVVRAEADVQAAKLGNAVEQQVGGAVDEARLDAPAGPAAASLPAPAATVRATDPYIGTSAVPVYYVRDQQGRFVPVARP